MSRLYKPAPAIEVIADPAGRPRVVNWRGGQYAGQTVDHWRVETAWWEEPVARDYYLVETEYLVCEVYRDRLGDGWYMHRVYD
ncbi:MAG: hypothetical protein ACYC5O_12795 [Anaerolineae bacterium]